MQKLIRLIKAFIPKPIFVFLQPYYHYFLAWFGAVRFKYPSRHIFVIGVTGTKGKSTVTELVARILREDGKKTASLSTIQFSIGDKVERNLFKMTMPGRFFVQHFLQKAIDANCTHAVVEMTSEGAKQFRHRFVELDAFIFTNLTPEHIESHGSFENYKKAKLSIVGELSRSKKRPRFLVANNDDEHGKDFLAFEAENILPYSLKDLSLYSLHRDSVSLVFGEHTLRVPLIGLFNVYNIIAAVTLCRAMGVSMKTIDSALRDIDNIPGRVELFSGTNAEGAKVTAVVDYAHTPDSLEKLYQAFPGVPKICVLGNTGGGRDTWKRPEMAGIAEKYCSKIFLTNEDPYDEDPKKIVEQMASGIENKDKLTIIMDRREAIRTAINSTPPGGYALITGKGTDPYIMGPNDSKEKWSDAETVKEAFASINRTQK